MNIDKYKDIPLPLCNLDGDQLTTEADLDAFIEFREECAAEGIIEVAHLMYSDGHCPEHFVGKALNFEDWCVVTYNPDVISMTFDDYRALAIIRLRKEDLSSIEHEGMLYFFHHG